MFPKYKKWLFLAIVALIPILSGCDGCDKKKYVAPPPAPSSPSNLTATAVSSTQINLSWKDNSTNEKGFYLYRRTTNSYTRVAILEANANSYNDTGLDPETSYWYKVTAYNDGGESGSSNEVNITTPAGPTPSLPELEAPSNLSITVVSYKQINLSWQDNSTTEDGLRVRCNIGHTQTNTIATVGPDTIRYEHCKLQPMTHHKYYIEAFRGEETAGSPQVSATTPCPVELTYFTAYFVSHGVWMVEVIIHSHADEGCLVEVTCCLYDKETGRCLGTAKHEVCVNAQEAGQHFWLNVSQESEPESYPPCDYTVEITDVEIDY
ncbi:hypothetical protein ES702_03078 [subsurface metagenome]